MLNNFLNSSYIYLNSLLVALVLLNATYLHSAMEYNTKQQNESILNENSDNSKVDEMELDDITYRNLQILHGHPDYIEDHRLRLEQLHEESTYDQLASLDIFSTPSYLFLREGSGFLYEQKIADAKKVHSNLKKKKLSKVNFDSGLLNDSVNGHTWECTKFCVNKS